jgi:hypothetical protein
VVALAGKFCSRLIEKKKNSLDPWDRLREGRVESVTEPPKQLGPPTVVLVHRTSDNPVGAPKLLDKFGIFPYLTRNVSPVLQTLQNIGDEEMRKRIT